MQPLATGILVIKNLRHNLRKSAAFTLLEVMVVLVIMAIITAVAMLSLHLFSHARRVTVVAQQLTQALKVAENEAVLRPGVFGLRFTQQGYQFYELQLDKKHHAHWAKLSNDKLSQPSTFSKQILTNLVTLENKEIGESDEENHYIVFSPNGTVSSFSLMISDDNHERTYEIKADENGVIELHEVSSS